MFDRYRKQQHYLYLQARQYFISNYHQLLDLEKYISLKIHEILQNSITEIVSDYDEASYLYPFWQNYPPNERRAVSLIENSLMIRGMMSNTTSFNFDKTFNFLPIGVKVLRKLAIPKGSALRCAFEFITEAIAFHLLIGCYFETALPNNRLSKLGLP